jgi:hypothetical protein
MQRITADSHDLLAVERFLAAETRIAGTFGHIEEAVAPLLRSMRARDRTTYVVDAERGAILGHAFLRPPYAPSPEAEWFVAWGLRFPDGGTGWRGPTRRCRAACTLWWQSAPRARERSSPLRSHARRSLAAGP